MMLTTAKGLGTILALAGLFGSTPAAAAGPSPTASASDETNTAAAPASPSHSTLEWSPLLGVRLGQQPQRLRLETAELREKQTRQLWRSAVTAGLDLRVPASQLPLDHFDSRFVTAISFGFVHLTGQEFFELDQSALLHHELGAGFGVSMGPRIGTTLNLANASQSSLSLGAALALEFHFVELWYGPSWVVPLGRSTESVASGRTLLSTGPGPAPVGFGLRVRWPG